MGIFQDHKGRLGPSASRHSRQRTTLQASWERGILGGTQDVEHMVLQMSTRHGFFVHNFKMEYVGKKLIAQLVFSLEKNHHITQD